MKIRQVYTKKNIVMAWIVVAIWMLVIFCFSAQKSEESNKISLSVSEVFVEITSGDTYTSNDTIDNPSNVVEYPEIELDIYKINNIIRKIAHIIVYMLLAILTGNALYRSKINILWAVLICILYSISDEIHQLFVIGRSGLISDVFIDSFGVIFGIKVYFNIDAFMRFVKSKHIIR